MLSSLRPLPIDPHLPEILERLRGAASLVLQSSPGSGKTTRVPPYLLDSGLLRPDQEMLVLVPRRLAAKMSALRVAEERGEAIGGTVGYQFRFENVLGPRTRLKFLTEGMLLRYLLQDPRLSKAGLVILDEFHERHLHSDVALSYLRRLQGGERPDLKLLVMSATLEAEALVQFLGKAAALKYEVPAFSVDIEYLPGASARPLEQRIGDALSWLQEKSVGAARAGDVLVFLPGMGEIRRSAETLKRRFGEKFLVLPLHGELPREEQIRVFQKADRRKVILATNVAETSLTIEGVTAVVDTGLHRQASYSWWNGVPALKTRPISRASGIQRAGRAGRTAPGLCLRLFSKADWESRLAFETSEIRRSDLSQTLLEIKAMGVSRLSDFTWFESPPDGALQAACVLLFQLGATAGPELDAPLTQTGQRMAELPIHPRLARMLLEAESRRCLALAARLAALISEDTLEELEALHQVETDRCSEGVRRLQRLLLGYFPNSGEPQKSEEEALAYAALCGFPDRVARRRTVSGSAERPKPPERGPELELVFCSGGAGTVKSGGVLGGDFFVVLDVQEKQHHGQAHSKVHVSSLIPVKPEWLFDWQGSLLNEKSELIWDETAGRVTEINRIQFGALILSENKTAPQNLAAAEAVLLRGALGLDLDSGDADPLTVSDLLERLSRYGDPAPMEELLARLALGRPLFSKQEIPDLQGEGLKEFLGKIFLGVLNRDQLEPAVLARHAELRLSSGDLAQLNKLLPMQLSLPAGRRVRVHYPWGKAPWIESRLQDFFGMEAGPQLAGGRVPLVLHLLAPNRRAVQVTQDLRSFWKNTYPQIRRELKRRYPRHAWPEDPLAG